MNLVIRVALGLIGLFFAAVGIRIMVQPEVMAAAQFFVEPDGPAGLSTVRGELGGLFVAVATFIFLGIRARAQLWLAAAATALVAVAIGRVIGLLADGVSDSAVSSLVIELIFVAILITGALRLKANPE